MAQISEGRLDSLRREAAEHGSVQGGGVRPAGAPFPQATGDTGYYGVPLLQEPVWTWEIPVYFWLGGAAGAAAPIALFAGWFGRKNSRLARDASLIAAAGGIVSPVLLILDLGRPGRFLNMLRVIKPQSPMSVGVWLLAGFSKAAVTAALPHVLGANGRRLPVRLLGGAGRTGAALTGPLVSTYTAVLIGATAIPVWARNVRLLPIHFGASSLGSAVGWLELLGHRNRALTRLAILAAAVEIGVETYLESRNDRALDPIKKGWTGWGNRVAALMMGAAPLGFRLLAGRDGSPGRPASGWMPDWRQLAALSTVAGAYLSRLAWVKAGSVSARDPRVPLDLPDRK
jgi:hypothetical protein